MTTLARLKTRWLQMRIAYHRRKAHSYKLPMVGSHRREQYNMWLQNMALRHSIKAHDLEQRLAIAGARA